MSNTQYVYRFEVRGGGYRPEFTDNPKTAMVAAYNRSETTSTTITVVDNDSPCPYARVYKGVAEFLQ